MSFVRMVCFLILALLCGGVLAKDKALDLNLRAKYRNMGLTPQMPGEMWQDPFVDTKQPPTVSFGGSGEGSSIADVWCKSITRTFWTHSLHPGGDHGGRLNQDNWGVGFKCRIARDDPLYVTVDALTNSQRGTSFATSFGKQLDVVSFYGVKAYVGISATMLSYEMPGRHKTMYGIVPMPHRGISYELPGGWGNVGMEEQFLPQGIKLRSVNILIRKKLDIF